MRDTTADTGVVPRIADPADHTHNLDPWKDFLWNSSQGVLRFGSVRKLFAVSGPSLASTCITRGRLQFPLVALQLELAPCAGELRDSGVWRKSVRSGHSCMSGPRVGVGRGGSTGRQNKAGLRSASRDDGQVLLDRLWPRGMTKERVGANAWMKDLAHSTALRSGSRE